MSDMKYDMSVSSPDDDEYKVSKGVVPDLTDCKLVDFTIGKLNKLLCHINHVYNHVIFDKKKYLEH